jgi:hypothetical protein
VQEDIIMSRPQLAHDPAGRATPRNRYGRALLALALATAFAARSAAATDRPNENAVARWNAIATDAFTPSQGTNPMAQSRTLAILHAAVHDALNAIEPRFKTYSTGVRRARGASAPAAVAAAARDVLVTLLPEQAAFIETEYARALAAIPDGPAKSAGLAVGQASARANITLRAHDGAADATQPVYVPRPGPGEYRFTPPFDFAAQPGWGQVRPFVIDIREHAVDGPLDLSSEEYARDLAHVKAIGGRMSAIRTREQSDIARFWYEDSPLGWNRITNTVVRQHALDLWSSARAFALVNFAMADGFIAGFEAKYRFRFWRPETAIHVGAQAGSRVAEADAAWRPFLITPPVPDYPSTHTVLGWAAAEVLIELFGDRVEYSADSLTLPGLIRHYRGFSAAADENGQSRLYAGIHFSHAIRDGRRQGRSIGRAAAQALGPVRATPAD